MTKEIVLNKKDINLLSDVLEYFMSDEGVEKQDFIEQFGKSYFDVYDNLCLDACSEKQKSHVFYKMSVLSQNLLNEVM